MNSVSNEAAAFFAKTFHPFPGKTSQHSAGGRDGLAGLSVHQGEAPPIVAKS